MVNPPRVTNIDTGFPPTAVQEQNALREKLIEEPLTDSDLEALEALEKLPPAPPVPAPPQITASRRIVLEWLVDGKRALKFQFSAMEVDVGDHYITLILEPSLWIEPSDVMEMNLTFLNTVYPVAWVGSNFKFKLAGVSANGISFLRKIHDQNRTSESGNNPEPGQRKTV